MRKGILLFVLLIVSVCLGFSQDTTKTTGSTQIIEGDTIALVDVKAVLIFPPVEFPNKRASARYDKLVYNVKKVYPYAKLAGKQLAAYQAIIDTIASEKERRLFIKQAEKELEDRFGDELKQLTFSQGKILIKLIYRETGNSTFDLVRQLRGKLIAFIWQTFAKLFGYDLKAGYDPGGADHAIEQIVLMIEAGAI
ncbi:MAG: DUF4294 domain-containing protein [Bacteroidales bacterium]|nr:DUF4294 domain-containing protein [Bacteroidales bacterium]